MTAKIQEKTVDAGINQHILNIVTPSGIDYDDRHANIGENYGALYVVSKYPMDGVNYGWLAPLCNLENTITSVEFRYVDSSKVIEALNKKYSDDQAELATKKDESEKQVLSKKLEQMKELINRLSVNQEPVGYVNILFYIQSPNREVYEDFFKRVMEKIAIQGSGLRCLNYRQAQALRCISPYGIPDRMISNKGARPLPLSSVMGGFPMAGSGLYDENGYYLGKTEDEKRIIILNSWIRNKDRVNSNWLITGVPGVGKSTFVKDLFTLEYAFGTKIIVFDIEREYIDMVRHPDISGEVIDGAGGTTGRLNPLQIRYTPRVTEEDLEPGEKLEDFLQYDTENGLSDMALHIQNLRNFFRLYFGKKEYTAGIKVALEECLIEAYNRKRITWESDISKLKPENYPILSDVYDIVGERLQKKEITEYKRNNYDQLRDMLFPVAKGADQFLWNGPTTLNPKSDFIVIDSSKLMELDDNVRNAQFYNLQMWGWHEMSKDRTEKVILAADEGYNYVDPDYPELMKFFRNVSKRDRKYEGGLVFITHGVSDVLDPAVKRMGQAIIDNSCYKFIMGCDGKNLEDTKNLFNLTKKEVDILGKKIRGNGILFVGNTRMNANIEVSDKFLEMFGKAGGR